MAITVADWLIWRALKARGVLPARPLVLEIGEANWFGDVPLDVFKAELSPEGQQQLDWLVANKPETWLFDLAELFYASVLDYQDIDAFDLHGTSSAIKIDLNAPIDWPQQYDIVINTGTAEHCFNIAHVLKTIHDLTRAGGLMYHCFPFRGWLDHGFWAINPTLIHDLGDANGYERLGCWYSETAPQRRVVALAEPSLELELSEAKGELGKEAMLYVVWRKQPFRNYEPGWGEFKTPSQHYYATAGTGEPVRASSHP